MENDILKPTWSIYLFEHIVTIILNYFSEAWNYITADDILTLLDFYKL